MNILEKELHFKLKKVQSIFDIQKVLSIKFRTPSFITGTILYTWELVVIKNIVTTIY